MIDVRETEEFSDWLGKLRDARAKAKIVVRIDRLARGNPGDVAPVGEGVSELRTLWTGISRLLRPARQEVHLADSWWTQEVSPPGSRAAIAGDAKHSGWRI